MNSVVGVSVRIAGLDESGDETTRLVGFELRNRLSVAPHELQCLDSHGFGLHVDWSPSWTRHFRFAYSF